MRSGMIVLGLVVGSLAGGCGFKSSPGAPGDSGPGGGNGDGGNGDGSSDCPTSFASLFATCSLAFNNDLTLSGTLTYNTTTHVLTGATTSVTHQVVVLGSGEVEVLSAHDIQLTENTVLRAIGTRPLAIVASGSITLSSSAKIDVNGHQDAGGSIGAGAQTSCANGATAGQPDSAGAGGGGGGGFGGDGGGGGKGHNNASNGGAKGPAVGSVPAGLLGGCPGGDGGTGKSPGGAGGAGGGALYLAAANQILLDGAEIDAGGGGGRGGPHGGGTSGEAGGGGGGSGGLVILEAPQIMGNGAAIAANGGGGGGGSDGSGAGADGGAGLVAFDRADGGAGSGSSSTGGRGGAKGAPSGDSVTDTVQDGGGGGGGGVGIILFHPHPSGLQLDAATIVSPDPR